MSVSAHYQPWTLKPRPVAAGYNGKGQLGRIKDPSNENLGDAVGEMGAALLPVALGEIEVFAVSCGSYHTWCVPFSQRDQERKWVH